MIDFQTLNNLLSEKSLVSIMMANNEIGTIQPIKQLARIVHDHNSLFHTDAVQAVGHIPVDVRDLDVDFYLLLLINLMVQKVLAFCI